MDLACWAGSTLVVAIALGALGWLALRWRRPVIAHGAFLLALLKLLLPPFVAFELGEPGRLTVAGDANVLASGPSGINVAPTSGAEPNWSWPSLLVGVWGLGSVIALTWSAWRTVRLLRWVSGLRAASISVQRDVESFARVLRLRRVPRVRVTTERISPMVCAGWRGVSIVLPTTLLAELSREELDTVLVHELAHVKRRDYLVRLLELLAAAVWWWLPVLPGFRRGLHRAEELCCDAVVMRTLPERAADYRVALVATADFITPAPACGAGPIRELEERMQMIHSPKLSSRSWSARLLLCAMAGVALPFAACEASRRVEVIAAGGAAGAATVLGAVRRSVKVPVESDVTLLEVLARAELLKDADMGRVMLIRAADDGDPLVLEADVRAMITTGNTAQNVLLASGDIVYVPRASEVVNARSAGLGPLVNKSKIERGDLVLCEIDPAFLRLEGAERLATLTRAQRIGAEGTIFVPFVGSMKVEGLTTKQAGDRLKKSLSSYFNSEVPVQVRAGRRGE